VIRDVRLFGFQRRVAYLYRIELTLVISLSAVQGFERTHSLLSLLSASAPMVSPIPTDRASAGSSGGREVWLVSWRMARYYICGGSQ
jgi:hypothetical protein